jgi:ABC-type dipeptide/oligopeptide/nickel transport system ATPase subunit
MSQIDKLLAESQLQDLEKAFKDSEKYDSQELLKLKEEFQKMKEDGISGGDWGRIGIMAGMLWYKLDTLISHLSTMSNHLQNIERNTSRISK